MQRKLINLFIFLLILSIAGLIIPACDSDDDSDSGEDKTQSYPVDDDDDDDQSISISFLTANSASPELLNAVDDAIGLLEGALGIEIARVYGSGAANGNILIAIDDKETNADLFEPGETDDLESESFMLRSKTIDNRLIYAIVGADDRGAQYGIYELLERFGFRFLHPEKTVKPTRSTIQLPDHLDVYESPSYPRRGFHIHTMHPIEATEFLMRDDPDYLRYAKNLLNWHVRNKQNYIQWELLRTVDFDKNLEHFQAIAEYAHSRLMDIGIVVSYVFQQQKAWKIVPNMRRECKAEMQANIDQLMQVPWDHINLEMGSSEFTQVKDQMQVKWMDNTVAYLKEKYPGTEASVKVHCSTGQTAPNYGNINFNLLAQFADPGMGVYPHTVMFYDLVGPAPVYDNDNFDWLVNWTLEMVDQRKVYYYPETAYWCSFDIDVPLFLPVYVYNRWKDIVYLADKGLAGHVTFTSGHEWMYWLNDLSVAQYTWDSSMNWTDILDFIAPVFGDAGKALADLIEELTIYQEEMLIKENMAPYPAGEDTWDELGYIVHTTTHPKVVTFREIYRMNEEEIAEFQNDVLVKLENMADTYQDLLERAEAQQDNVSIHGLYWYEELVDSFRTNAYRALHAYYLWSGAAAMRLFELNDEASNEEAANAFFEQATAITPKAIELMHNRESQYRYPLNLSITEGRNYTSYDFKYLWQASTGYWYIRWEKQAIDKKFNPLLMNVINPIWFMF